jgi:hypothetical protein
MAKDPRHSSPLRKIRLQHGLTQSQLAEIAGVEPKTGATLGEWDQFTQTLLHSALVCVFQRHTSRSGPPGHGPATRREPGNPCIDPSSLRRQGITRPPALLLPPSDAAWQPPGYWGTCACSRQEAASLVLPACTEKCTGMNRNRLT